MKKEEKKNHSPVSKKDEVTYSPVSKKDEVTYSPLIQNQFFKNMGSYLRPVSECGIFEIFLKAFGLDKLSSEDCLRKAEEINNQIAKEIKTARFHDARFKICYMLRELRKCPHGWLAEKISINPRHLAELLAELRERRIAKVSDKADPSTQFQRGMLKYIGEERRRAMYEIDYNNPVIAKLVKVLDSFVPDDFKLEVAEKKKWLEQTRKHYKKHLELGEQKEQLKYTGDYEKIMNFLDNKYQIGEEVSQKELIVETSFMSKLFPSKRKVKEAIGYLCMLQRLKANPEKGTYTYMGKNPKPEQSKEEIPQEIKDILKVERGDKDESHHQI